MPISVQKVDLSVKYRFDTECLFFMHVADQGKCLHRNVRRSNNRFVGSPGGGLGPTNRFFAQKRGFFRKIVKAAIQGMHILLVGARSRGARSRGAHSSSAGQLPYSSSAR
ncbi:hypothetical protein [Enorma phocaeensis]|uniref:hypothetical protein n=1 Tax=Enorma phocaeensis TaxID=1871019 RepID=UPI0019571AAB|nr:hypothetical protein [Enorma phocaeensis]MBM6953110.1 hypothetical protein [Enorma phocaeensis]